MEQNKGQGDFVDLSQVLDKTDGALTAKRRSKEKILKMQKTPTIYRLVFKLSGGLIKTERQAMCIVVMFLILINALTFSLASGVGSTALKTNASESSIHEK
ncbi:MAG: hypothetical protein PHX30_01985 [Candidatus Pacebacteria bacterium]|jgi:hypothetical protein|nr:hypothetical protein [Candidatus Paceibacterota bacterium]